MLKLRSTSGVREGIFGRLRPSAKDRYGYVAEQRLAVYGFEVLGPLANSQAPRVEKLLNNPATAHSAAETLALISPNGALPILALLSRNPSRSLREAAIIGLGRLCEQDFAAAVALAECSKDTDPHVRALCLCVLTQAATNVQVQTVLVSGLKDPDDGARYCAARALAHAAPPQPGTLAALNLAASTDASQLVRQAAADALARLSFQP